MLSGQGRGEFTKSLLSFIAKNAIIKRIKILNEKTIDKHRGDTVKRAKSDDDE